MHADRGFDALKTTKSKWKQIVGKSIGDAWMVADEKLDQIARKAQNAIIRIKDAIRRK